MKHQNPIFIPGPSNTPDVLKTAMNISNFDHRAPDFADDYLPLLEDLKKVFKTETGQVLLFSATGTGGWEGAMTNTLCAGDKVLIARYGMFSQRWIDLCQRFGLDVEVIECEWGTGAPVEEFARRLQADQQGDIKAVLVTHNETATAVKSDVLGVRQAIDDAHHNALFMVDAVSSLYGLSNGCLGRRYCYYRLPKGFYAEHWFSDCWSEPQGHGCDQNCHLTPLLL